MLKKKKDPNAKPCSFQCTFKSHLRNSAKCNRKKKKRLIINQPHILNESECILNVHRSGHVGGF